MLAVITGAAGSGKSAYAEQLLCRLAARDGLREKIYVATMENDGAEARERIARHRKLREGKGFTTVEAPYGFSDGAVITDTLSGNLSGIFQESGEQKAVLLECVSNLLANLMFGRGMTEERAQEEIVSQIRAAAGRWRHTVVVTNEIFSGGDVCTGELGAYVRALGCVNVRLAAEADAFCEVVYTVPLFLKGENACRF